MDLMLKGKTAIITGGASNIGRQVVLTMAEEGANIAIFDLDLQGAQKVSELVSEKEGGGSISSYQVDITDAGQVEASVQRVIEDFGQVDILANVAGWASDQMFLDETREKQEKMVKINFWGPLNMIHAVLPHMVSRQYGRIATVSSDAGRMGEFREAVYAGAKGGVIALTKALAREVGKHNVTLNCVCPGMTPPKSVEQLSTGSFWHAQLDFFTEERQERATRLYPLRRLGVPDDTANMLVFLASDRSSFVTGQTISVSGGYTMM